MWIQLINPFHFSSEQHTQCDWWTNAFPRDSHFLVFETCEYITLYGKKYFTVFFSFSMSTNHNFQNAVIHPLSLAFSTFEPSTCNFVFQSKIGLFMENDKNFQCQYKREVSMSVDNSESPSLYNILGFPAAFLDQMLRGIPQVKMKRC